MEEGDSQREPAIPRTVEQASRWNGLSTKQNDFVARILDDCRSLEKRVDEEEQRLQLIGGFEMREPEDKLERQMRRIKQEREVQEAVEEVATYQAIVAELRHAVQPSSPSPYFSAASGASASSSSDDGSLDGRQGPPFILILIDGTKAPFYRGAFGQGFVGGKDAALRLRWEIEKDLKEHPLHIDEGTENEGRAERPTILSFVLVDPQVLLPRLQRQRVLSAETFEAFIQGFQSFPEHNVVKAADGNIGTLADLLLNFGHSPSLERIYLGGAGYDRLCNTTPGLRPSNHSFYVEVGSKMALINCSETPDERDELHKSGWRIVDFKGLFDVDLAKPASFVASQGPAASTLGGQQSTSSDDVFASRAARYRTFIKPGSKHVFDPFKKILQQEPEICVWHYVSAEGCNQVRCDRSHKYDLTSAGLQALREEVSTVRCKEKLRTGKCNWRQFHGTPCMFSHDFVVPKRNGKSMIAP